MWGGPSSTGEPPTVEPGAVNTQPNKDTQPISTSRPGLHQFERRAKRFGAWDDRRHRRFPWDRPAPWDRPTPCGRRRPWDAATQAFAAAHEIAHRICADCRIAAAHEITAPDRIATTHGVASFHELVAPHAIAAAPHAPATQVCVKLVGGPASASCRVRTLADTVPEGHARRGKTPALSATTRDGWNRKAGGTSRSSAATRAETPSLASPLPRRHRRSHLRTQSPPDHHGCGHGALLLFAALLHCPAKLDALLGAGSEPNVLNGMRAGGPILATPEIVAKSR